MLTPEQLHHNAMLDLEIRLADKYNRHVKEMNDMKIKLHEKFLEDHPDHFFKSYPGLDMRGPRTVIGIRYVDLDNYNEQL